MIEVQEFDNLVVKTYGKIYSFQQQDGCKSRGVEHFTIPESEEDYENDTVPEIVNHEEMGVSFKAWLKRNPKTPIKKENGCDFTALWWSRNFYPHVSMILNDLYKKGLLPKGNLSINIDW
jgi:hypothetical protein